MIRVVLSKQLLLNSRQLPQALPYLAYPHHDYAGERYE